MFVADFLTRAPTPPCFTPLAFCPVLGLQNCRNSEGVGILANASLFEVCDGSSLAYATAVTEYYTIIRIRLQA
jgi:hypothetical protein